MRLRRLGSIAGVVIALTTGAGLRAEPDPGDDPPIDLSLRDASTLDVLRAFARIRGLDLDLATEVDGVSTVELDGVPWSEAVRQVCRINGLSCTVDEARGLLRVRTPDAASRPEDQEAPPIELALRAADLHHVLQSFGRIAGWPVAIDPAVERATVTVNLDRVPWPTAIESVCALAGCRVGWREETVAIEPLPAEARARRRLSLHLDNAPLVQLVDAFRGLPMFGRRLAVALDPDLADVTISLSVDDATWTELLDAACRGVGCAWKMVYHPSGDPELRVELLDESLEAALDLPAWRGTLEEAGTLLAERLDLRVRIDPALEPTGDVHLASAGAAGHLVLDQLAAQLDALWHLDGDRIVIEPNVKRLAHHPPRALPAHGLSVTTSLPDGPTATVPMAFDWRRPNRSLVVDETALTLVWLSFGAAGSYLVGLVYECDAPARAVEVLDPIPLPIGDGVRRVSDRATIDLRTEHDGATSPRARSSCAVETDLRLTIEVDEATATIPGIIGTQLMITPSPNEARTEPSPTLAVISLGSTADGHLAYLLVHRDPDGLRVERHEVGPRGRNEHRELPARLGLLTVHTAG